MKNIVLGLCLLALTTQSISAKEIDIIDHGIYNEIRVGNDLEIDIVTDPSIISSCMDCGDFPSEDPRVKTRRIPHKNSITYYEKAKPINCSEKIDHQPSIKFKTPQTFKTRNTLYLYKEPVDCPSVKTNKTIKKGTKFTSLKYSKFGWVKVKNKGWVKGFLLDPKISYKPKLKKVTCPICKDWSKD